MSDKKPEYEVLLGGAPILREDGRAVTPIAEVHEVCEAGEMCGTTFLVEDDHCLTCYVSKGLFCAPTHFVPRYVLAAIRDGALPLPRPRK